MSRHDVLPVRDQDRADEPSAHGPRDALHADEPELVLPVVLAREGGRALRRRRERVGPEDRERAAHRGAVRRFGLMDLAARLQQLEDMVRDAKSMPLSSSALLNREEVLDLVKDMKETLPDEIRQARWVVKDREELLAKARRDAEAMVEQGQEEQLRLASREAVV